MGRVAMGRTGALAALVTMALAGCGGGGGGGVGRFVFGDSPSDRTLAEARAAAVQPVVDQVVSLSVAPTPSGAIVSTVGLPPTQGFWEAELVAVPSGDPSVLLLDFRILPPITQEPAGTQPSREVLAGRAFSRQDLAGIRTIAVQGARNRQSVSR